MVELTKEKIAFFEAVFNESSGIGKLADLSKLRSLDSGFVIGLAFRSEKGDKDKNVLETSFNYYEWPTVYKSLDSAITYGRKYYDKVETLGWLFTEWGDSHHGSYEDEDGNDCRFETDTVSFVIDFENKKIIFPWAEYDYVNECMKQMDWPDGFLDGKRKDEVGKKIFDGRYEKIKKPEKKPNNNIKYFRPSFSIF